MKGADTGALCLGQGHRQENGNPINTKESSYLPAVPLDPPKQQITQKNRNGADKTEGTR